METTIELQSTPTVIGPTFPPPPLLSQRQTQFHPSVNSRPPKQSLPRLQPPKRIPRLGEKVKRRKKTPAAGNTLESLLRPATPPPTIAITLPTVPSPVMVRERRRHQLLVRYMHTEASTTILRHPRRNMDPPPQQFKEKLRELWWAWLDWWNGVDAAGNPRT